MDREEGRREVSEREGGRRVKIRKIRGGMDGRERRRDRSTGERKVGTERTRKEDVRKKNEGIDG